MGGRRWTRALATVLALLMLAACGGGEAQSSGEAVAPSEPTSSETSAPTAPSPEAAATAAEAPSDIEAVYEQLAAVPSDQRREALTTMAAAEQESGGDFYLYTPLDPNELQPILEGFTASSGVPAPELYQASASSLRERLITEAAAGQVGGDIITGNSTEMLILSSEGIFEPLTSPVVEALERGVYEDWVAVFFSAFIGAWNTNGAAQVPQSWEEILTSTENLAMGGGDYDFLATLVKDYFMAELGMTEADAIEVFRQAACGATFVQGHTLQAELLAAGEFDFATSVYHHQIIEGMGEGAPVAWEPAIEPIVLIPNGAAIGRDTDRPASALLFLEHLLQDGQATFAELNRTPVASGIDGGVPSEHTTLIVDEEAQLGEREKWDALYEELTRCSGRPVRE